MATNEGVGKKIVEALKKQSGQEVELTPDYNETQVNTEEKTDFNEESFSEISSSNIDELYGEALTTEIDNEIKEVKEDSFEIEEHPVIEETLNVQNNTSPNAFDPNIVSMPQQPQGWNFGQQMNYENTYVNSQPQTNSIETPQAKQFDVPPNVAVLRRLITQLPAGVTRQTGAQIIKQTMEALGISMNTVLHEAQKVQDDLNDSIKNCMMSIQEYKNNIKNLERQGLDYQRQVNQLNDLISLFILSDKE